MALADLPVAKRHKLAPPAGDSIRNAHGPFLISAIVAFIEAGALLSLLINQITLEQLLMVHIGVVALLAVWFGLRSWRLGWSRSGLLIFGATALMGPFGAVGCLYALLIYLYFKRDARSFEDWYMTLFPEEEQDNAKALYEHIVSGREELDEGAGVVSFGDVMSYGNFEQKLAVLTLVTKHFRPEFSKILSAALADENAAIRVRAATAKAEIDDRYLTRSMRHTERLDAMPENPEAHLEMAKFLDEHAFSGLLAPDQVHDCRIKALEHFQKVIALDPERQEAVMPIIRGYLRIDDVRAAVEWIAKARSLGMSNPQLDDWEMECLFRLRDFSRLREAARQHYSRDPDNTIPTRMMGGIVTLWAEGLRGENSAKEPVS